MSPPTCPRHALVAKSPKEKWWKKHIAPCGVNRISPAIELSDWFVLGFGIFQPHCNYQDVYFAISAFQWMYCFQFAFHPRQENVFSLSLCFSLPLYHQNLTSPIQALIFQSACRLQSVFCSSFFGTRWRKQLRNCVRTKTGRHVTRTRRLRTIKSRIVSFQNCSAMVLAHHDKNFEDITRSHK